MLAAMLLCLLAACSSTTFVYNRLDSILPWYLDDYVDLNNTQDRQLDEMLAPFLAWHRQQELPRYVALLEQVEADLDGPVSAAEVAGIYAGIEDAWLRLQDKSLDWLLALGASLSDEQVQEFLEELNERQEEYEEEYLERSELEYRDGGRCVEALVPWSCRLAPIRFVGLAMGGWFLSTAIGNNLSGIFAGEVSGETGMTVASALSGFTFSFWLLLGAGIFLFLIAPLINKLMHGVK